VTLAARPAALYPYAVARRGTNGTEASAAEASASLRELLTREPRLAELESDVDAIHDDGSAPWFCSNFLWLPVNTRLRLLVGVARLPQPGDHERPELYSSASYERVFEHLSRRMPPCRACGCRQFDELRRESDREEPEARG
jgi:hypothetical protein